MNNMPHSLSQAALRLNQAFDLLEGRIARLQQERDRRPETKLLEQENLQLYEENRRLCELLESLEMRLELSLVQLENLIHDEERRIV